MTDGLVFSYSALKSFDTCQRQFYYQHFLNLRPDEDNLSMITGSNGHTLLQAFYTGLAEGKTKEEAHKLTHQKAVSMINRDRFVDDGLLYAWTLVDNYIRDNDFTAEAALVENRFLFPASALTDDPRFEHIHIGFTPDVVFKRAGGFHDVEDSKFIQRAWPEKKLKRFQQAKLYQIFLEYMGYKVSRSSVRFFNIKTGKITVKHDTMEAAEKETIIRDFLNTILDVIEHTDRYKGREFEVRRTQNTQSCQFCAFAFPCTLEAEGKDATKTFYHMYKKNDYNYAN